MLSRFAKLFRWWPIGILFLIEAILFAANYKPGTWLMGWDNVMPEFNFIQALKTNIFGIWQEHRGLGLYDGMGHAANLVHTLFLWLLSLILPTNLLRYSFHFLMHFAGGVGAYILLKKLIDNNNATALKLSTHQWIALSGALFYQYNLATIQMFYTPLEAFSVHFAALPWLGWSLITYLQEGSRKRFLVFLLISLLSTPQFFIPTLLLPITLLLVSISITSLTHIKRIGIAAVGFLLVNAFWLLPYVYGIPRNAPIIQAAKINQMSSGEVFARNQAFGGLGDVLRLRGFPLDFEDIATNGSSTFLMAPWREFLDKPVVTALSWLPIAPTLLGASSSGGVSFLVAGIISFTFLATDMPMVNDVVGAVRQAVPALAEAYRFPFTKFSLLFALSSTVLFSIGLARITKIRSVPIMVIGLIVILALPAFRGNFISDRLRVTLPDDYLRVFAFMRDKPLGRITYLPQQQYWSWKYYRWGYRGSGFTWYGLPQPILDRAFDPWSGYNENYYWELSRSIYSKNITAVGAVLAKYDVRYVLLDEHIISPSHNRALFTEEIKAMLASLPEIKEVARFGKLTVYERVGDDTKNFISTKKNLPTVSPAYRWTDNDVAFRELGDYVTNEIASPRSAGTRNDVWAYPFRSLFTKRSVDEREFTITETPDTITIGSIVEATGASIFKTDAIVYDSTKSADQVAENVKLCGVLREGEAMAENLDQFLRDVPDGTSLRFTSRNQRGCLSFGVADLPHRDGYLVSVESRHITGRPMLFSLINQTAKHVELETYLEKETSYFILPPLATDGLGYTMYLSNDAIGKQETVNDLQRIRVYRIPYQELVSLSLRAQAKQSLEIATSPAAPRDDILKVDHPNPAYYKIVLRSNEVTNNEATLILSQSFDPGWTAWEKTSTFPYLRQLKDHVLVNNWSNGWLIKSDQNEIVLYFLPQLWQWLGFALLPIPFLIVYLKKI